jgi:phosphoserine phosphatase
MEKPPIDPIKIITLIQKNRHIKLAGQDKLRITAAMPDLAGAREPGQANHQTITRITMSKKLILQGPRPARACSRRSPPLAGPRSTRPSTRTRCAATASTSTPALKAGRAAAEAAGVDATFIDAGRSLADFRLVAMDMDSTLITIECIDEIADMQGLKPQVSAITEAAMRGELDFSESLKRRVALLEGLPVEALARVYEERLRLSMGARGDAGGVQAPA